MIIYPDHPSQFLTIHTTQCESIASQVHSKIAKIPAHHIMTVLSIIT